MLRIALIAVGLAIVLLGGNTARAQGQDTRNPIEIQIVETEVQRRDAIMVYVKEVDCHLDQRIIVPVQRFRTAIWGCIRQSSDGQSRVNRKPLLSTATDC